MKLNIFLKNRIIFLLSILLMLLLIYINTNIIGFIIIFLFLLFMYLINLKYKDHSVFILFILFYGIFSRIIFFITSAYKYNPIYILPILYPIIFYNSIKFNNDKRKNIILFIYIFLPLIYIFLPRMNNIFYGLISYIALIIPIFYAMFLKNNKNIIRILYWVFPIIIIYSLFQFYNKFFIFDSFWINFNKSTITSLYLGGNFRPFSVFTSPEEYGQFLSIFLILPFYYKHKINKIYFIISFVLLFIFSYRLPIIMFIAFLIVYLIKNKKIKIFISIIVIFILFSVFLNIIDFNDNVKNDETGIIVSIKHSTSPFKNIFKSYSFKRRIGVIKENIKYFTHHILGYSLIHNNKINNNNFPGSESSIISLIMSCGIIMLFYILFILWIIIKKIIFEDFSFSKAMLFVATFFILFAHGLSLHFMTVIYYVYILKELYYE